MKEYSPYRLNLIAKSSKCFWSSLLDYALVFVLSFLLIFAAGIPTFDAIPAASALGEKMDYAQKQSSSIIASTHLLVYGEDLELLSSGEMAADYAEALVKTSYYLNGKPYPSSEGAPSPVDISDTFLAAGEYPHDSLSYYFLSFKETGEGISSYVYGGVDYSTDRETYLYKVAMGYDDPSYFDAGLSGDLPVYKCLAFSYAELIADYLVYGDTSGSATGAYDYFVDAYLKANGLFSREVESSYVPYVENRALLESSTQGYYSLFLLVCLCYFLLGYIILETVPPIVFGEGKTIGIKSFRLAYSKADETKPSAWNYAIKSLARLPIHVSVIGLCLMFLSDDFLGLLFLDLGGGFSIAYVILASLLLGLGSTVFCLVRKEHQGFAEAVSGLVVKDTEEAEASLPENERTEDGRE